MVKYCPTLRLYSIKDKHLITSFPTPLSPSQEFHSQPRDSTDVPADAADDLHVPRHDCDPLAVEGGQLGVLEEGSQVGLGCFLNGARDYLIDVCEYC